MSDLNKHLTVITLNQKNISDFATARNLALAKVKTNWVFFLDSDETIPLKLQLQILKATTNKNFNYQIRRQDIFLNKTLYFGETAAVRLTRLIQKGTGRWQGTVHETFVSQLPVKTLKTSLVHHRLITLHQFLDRLNYYTDLRARELNNQGSCFCGLKLLLYPPLKFIYHYFILLGFLDGLPGLAMAFFMSLHSLFVRIKLYELKNS